MTGASDGIPTHGWTRTINLAVINRVLWPVELHGCHAPRRRDAARRPKRHRRPTATRNVHHPRHRALAPRRRRRLGHGRPRFEQVAIMPPHHITSPTPGRSTRTFDSLIPESVRPDSNRQPAAYETAAPPN